MKGLNWFLKLNSLLSDFSMTCGKASNRSVCPVGAVSRITQSKSILCTNLQDRVKFCTLHQSARQSYVSYSIPTCQELGIKLCTNLHKLGIILCTNLHKLVIILCINVHKSYVLYSAPICT